MRKRIILVGILAVSLFYPQKAYADTAADLFKKYNIDGTTELDKATVEWNKATSAYRNLLKDYAFNDLYNTAVALSDSSDLVDQLNIYQPICYELETKMLSNIDADITEIISDENKYMKALETVNFLLNAMDSYRSITNADIPAGDLNSLKLSYDEATVKKDLLVSQADIGVITGIIQPIQAEYKLVSGYGTRAIVGNGSKTEFHHGIDLAAEIGTGVLSVFNGIVIYSDYDQNTGETIKIDHGNSIVSIYENLRDRYVKQGDTVKQYQKIGAVGMTSKETVKPYLHLSLYIKNKSYNPDLLFRKESN